MKALLIVLCFFVVSGAYTQKNSLSFSEPGSDKVIIFKENKRVRVKTIDGGKITGKLKIVDENQVKIKNIIIPISSIIMIKRNPLAQTILVSGTFIAAGSFLIVGGLAFLVWGGGAASLAAFIPGGGFLALGIISPNFARSVHIHTGTNIKVLAMDK